MSAEMRFASPIRGSRPIAGFLILWLLFLGTFRCRFVPPSAAHADRGSGGLPRRMVCRLFDGLRMLALPWRWETDPWQLLASFSDRRIHEGLCSLVGTRSCRIQPRGKANDSVACFIMLP
ncbi:hypothetical protein C4D60_Mb04t11100 [Musa balbisiana]|uniref:Uncharacterized protein n=1 Tax=Musa balbisiana TaxID=52838 RepID=A0A4S8KB76_MUSBA|nr:hypothetical protein C4D60_Mb04t11100 [Musa balbisiana]